jgi:hypothetical protein
MGTVGTVGVVGTLGTGTVGGHCRFPWHCWNTALEINVGCHSGNCRNSLNCSHSRDKGNSLDCRNRWYSPNLGRNNVVSSIGKKKSLHGKTLEVALLEQCIGIDHYTSRNFAFQTSVATTFTPELGKRSGLSV